MTVQELIDFLQTHDRSLICAYSAFSEQILLESKMIGVEELCLPRPDGWIQNKRPDMPTQEYLLFPGN
jgi:hypothetical protein